MLSGIGPKSELQKHGIRQVLDLPVGQNLQDHPIVHTGYVWVVSWVSQPINRVQFLPVSKLKSQRVTWPQVWWASSTLSTYYNSTLRGGECGQVTGSAPWGSYNLKLPKKRDLRDQVRLILYIQTAYKTGVCPRENLSCLELIRSWQNLSCNSICLLSGCFINSLHRFF